MFFPCTSILSHRVHFLPPPCPILVYHFKLILPFLSLKEEKRKNERIHSHSPPPFLNKKKEGECHKKEKSGRDMRKKRGDFHFSLILPIFPEERRKMEKLYSKMEIGKKKMRIYKVMKNKKTLSITRMNKV